MVVPGDMEQPPPDDFEDPFPVEEPPSGTWQRTHGSWVSASKSASLASSEVEPR